MIREALCPRFTPFRMRTEMQITDTLVFKRDLFPDLVLMAFYAALISGVLPPDSVLIYHNASTDTHFKIFKILFITVFIFI